MKTDADYRPTNFGGIDQHPKSEDIYRSVFVNGKDAIFLIRDGRIFDCNPKSLELFEGSRDKIINKSPAELSPKYQPNGEKSTDLIEKKLLQAYAGTQVIFKWTHTKLNGTIFEAEVSLNLVTLDNEKIFIAIVRDITERKKAEFKLSESENRYKSLIEKSPDSIVIQRNDKIVYVNPEAVQLSGLKNSSDLLGLNIYDFVHPEYKDLVKNRISATLNEYKETDRIEIKLINKSGGTVYVEASVSPIYYEDELCTFHFLRNITDRKIAHDALREHQRMLSTLIGNLPGVVYRCLNDQYYTMKFLSEGIAGLTGYDSYEFIDNKNLSFTEIIAPGDLASTREKINEALEKKIPFEVIYNVTAKDGKQKTVWERGQGIYMNGRLEAVEGFITDITERKDTEQALKQSEERFRSLFVNSSIGIYSTSISGKILMANPAVIEMLGYEDFEDLSKISITKSYLEDDGRRNFLNSLMESGEVLGYESAWLKKNGKSLFVRESARAIKDSKGNVKYIEGVVEDITDRKRAEEKLIETNLLLEKTFSSLGEAVFIIKQPGSKILACNPVVKEIFGFTRNELIGESADLLHLNDEYYEKFNGIIERGLQGNNYFQFEYKMKRKNGNIIVTENTVTTLFEDKGWQEGVVSVVKDITQRKAAEVNLIKAKKLAEQSDRLKSEFLAQMSHEIRTPVNAILSFASLLREDLEDKVNEDLKTSFDIMNRAGSRIIRTVDLILNMSEIQTGTYDYIPKKFDLYNDLLESIYLTFKPKAKEKGIDLILEKETENCEITADEYTVGQIFDNLVDNAIKFTKKGSVKVRVLLNDDEELTVEVIDTGVGIRQEYLPEIFLPFTQEEQGYTRKFEGSGLGLALVKKYCDLNKATLLVESEKDKGAKFTIIFPKELKAE